MPSPPVGLATKTGLAAAAGQFAAALTLVLVDGDHTTEATTALITAAVTLITVLQGRYAQATALTRRDR
jgi:hypothetical protein